MSSRNANLTLLMVVSLVVFFTNLGGPKLWDRDEPRNAGCAVEMMQAGDWVVPRFNDELRSHKPALLYWLMISAYSVFGVSEFSARFWSAVLGSLTVLLTYDLGRRLFNHQAGLWAGVCLATSLMFTVAARAATPDAPLIFFVTLSLWLYVRFSFPKTGAANSEELPPYYPQQYWQVMLIYGAMGLAVLSKGPVGLVLPTAIIGMFLLIQRLPAHEVATSWPGKLRDTLRPFAPLHFLKTVWFMRPGLALAACLAVALPWYAWVAVRNFEWIEGFFLEHNVHRAVTAFEGHSGPPIYYLGAICIGFFPWSVFFVPLFLDLRRQLQANRRQRAGLILCCCWVGVWLGAFSIAQTKLPSYITPLYPGLALLCGVFINRIVERRSEISSRWLDVAFGLTVVVGIVLTGVLYLLAQQFLPGREYVAGVALILALGGGLAWGLNRAEKSPWAFRAFAAMAVLFAVGLFAGVAQQVSHYQAIDRLLAKIEHEVPEHELCSFGVLEATWVYYAQQPVRFVADHPAQLQRHLAAGIDTILLTTPEKLKQLPLEMQSQLTEVAREPYFLKRTPLIALRPTPQLVQTSQQNFHDTTRR